MIEFRYESRKEWLPLPDVMAV